MWSVNAALLAVIAFTLTLLSAAHPESNSLQCERDTPQVRAVLTDFFLSFPKKCPL